MGPLRGAQHCASRWRVDPCRCPSHPGSRREAGVEIWTRAGVAARPESAPRPGPGYSLSVRPTPPRCAHSTPRAAPLGEIHHQRSPVSPPVANARFREPLRWHCPCRGPQRGGERSHPQPAMKAAAEAQKGEAMSVGGHDKALRGARGSLRADGPAPGPAPSNSLPCRA